MDHRQLAHAFQSRHQREPRLFQSPGRVNLIGEHTDYNDGFVFPCAINRRTVVAISARPDRVVRAESVGFEGVTRFSVDGDIRKLSDWSDYLRGVIVELRAAGVALTGAEVLIDSDVPLNSGLSSSASVEVATAIAFLGLAGHAMSTRDVALLCQRAENRFVGAPCGIMDQFACCHAEAGKAVLIDCRTLETRTLPLPEGFALLVCNSMVKHSVGGGEYGERRADCEESARMLGVKALRDVSVEEFERRAAELPERLCKRARHVVTENDRVLRAVEALSGGDTSGFGRLMNESHESLRVDFEASCAEIDTLVELARQTPGVAGARMTGGGFGGCTVNLVEADKAEIARESIASGYKERTGIQAETYVFEAAPAAGEIRL